jgi:hypothetical protein
MADPDISDELTQLGEFFMDAAKQMGDFIHQGEGNLPDAQITSLEQQLDQLTSYANRLIEASDQIDFANLANYVQGIQNATKKIQQDLAVIADINKAIAITAALLELGVGVLTQSGASIGAALQTIGGI